MRKVYHTPSNAAGMSAAIALGTSLAGLLFCVLPFSHLVNKPQASLELRKTGSVHTPPEADKELAPPVLELERPIEASPEPQLSEMPQAVPLSADLEVAAGSGGALAGFGQIRSLAAVEAVGQDAFDVSDLEKRPEAISQVAPVYPSELRKTKIEGAVTLVFILGDDGRVEDPRVETSTRPEFEKPALDAIRKWHFRPGEKDGKAVRTYIRIPIRFRVGNS